MKSRGKMKKSTHKKLSERFSQRKTTLAIIFILFFTFIFFMNLISSAVWTSGLEVGLIAWYDLNQTTDGEDIFFGTHNGTKFGNPSLTTGIIENAWDFDGTGDYINLTTNKLDFNFSSNLSISVWVKPDAGADGYIVSKTATLDTSYYMSVQAVGTVRGVILETDGTVIQTTHTLDFADEWQHVVLVANSSDVILYINNTQVHKVIYDGTIGSTDWAVLIGETQEDGSEPYEGLIDEVGFWNRSLTVDEISSLYNKGLAINPTLGATAITLNVPANNSKLIDTNIIFNATIESENTLKNATIFIFNSTGLFNQTEQTLSGNRDELSANITGFTNGNYLWNVFGCDTLHICNFASSGNFSFIYGISTPNQTLVSPVFETQSTTYNVTFNVTSGTPTANLWWNGTKFSGAGTNLGNNQWRFLRTLQTAIGDGLKNIFWEVISGVASFNTTGFQQNVSLTNLSFCQLGNAGIPYINFTYKNETVGQESTTAFPSSSTWVFWLGDGSVNKTTTYSNATELASHGFCVTPPDKTLNVDVSFSYDNSEAQQRTYNPATLSLTNSTTEQVLFLLPTNDGIFVTFQVLNAADQPISGATITLTRSGFGTIVSETTGSSGTVSIFLNPNFVYTLTVIAIGFDTFTTTQSFPTSEFTINLGTTEVTTPQDFSKGVSWAIQPKDVVLFNNTEYNFNFSLSSSFTTVSKFGFRLTNLSGATLGTISSNSNGGIVSIIRDTENQTSIIMQAFYIIDDGQINVSKSWLVSDKGDSQFSILQFVTDLKTFVTVGFFGLDDFGFRIIIFIIIFTFTGVLSFKFGLTSPLSLVGLMFALVAFFDLALGLMPNPIGAVKHFPTIFMAIITIGMIIRGGGR